MTHEGREPGPTLDQEAECRQPFSATPATVRLRDGSRVVIRPIDAGDRQALNAGFERMGRDRGTGAS